MNKLFTKIATACVGLAMAVGVGVAVGSNSNYGYANPSYAAYGDGDESVDFTDQGYTNQQVVDTYDGSDFSVSWDKGTNSNAPKYFTSGTAVRVYGGGTMTVSSSTKTLSKIEITGYSGNSFTTDVGTFDSGTWTGSSSSVVFTSSGTTGNTRVQKLDIYYESSGGDPVSYSGVEVSEKSPLTGEYKGDAYYECKATVTGTGAFSSAVTWSITSSSTYGTGTSIANKASIGTDGKITFSDNCTVYVWATAADGETHNETGFAVAVTTLIDNPISSWTKIIDDANISVSGIYALSNNGTHFGTTEVASSKIALTTSFSSIGYFAIESTDGGYHLRFATYDDTNNVWAATGKYVNYSGSNTNLSSSTTASTVWVLEENGNDGVFLRISGGRHLGINGTSEIKAYANQNIGTNLPAYLYEVGSLPVVECAEIELTGKPDGDMSIGDKATLGYSALDNNANEWVGDVTYSISNESVSGVVELSATTGASVTLTAKKAGTARVSVQDTAGNADPDYVDVTVLADPERIDLPVGSYSVVIDAKDETTEELPDSRDYEIEPKDGRTWYKNLTVEFANITADLTHKEYVSGKTNGSLTVTNNSNATITNVEIHYYKYLNEGVGVYIGENMLEPTSSTGTSGTDNDLYRGYTNITGNTFSLKNENSDYTSKYYSITITLVVADESEEFDSLTIVKGETQTQFTEGDAPSNVGLTVHENYTTDGGETISRFVDVTASATWDYSIEKIAANTASYTVTASYGGHTTDPVTVDGFTVAALAKYSLVSSQSELFDGQVVVLAVVGTYNKTASSFGNNYLSIQEANIVDEKIQSNNEMEFVVRMYGNQFALERSGSFLNYSGSSNAVYLSEETLDSDAAKCGWTLDEDGLYSVTGERYLKYNTSSPRFACYGPGSYPIVKLYKSDASVMSTQNKADTFLYRELHLRDISTSDNTKGTACKGDNGYYSKAKAAFTAESFADARATVLVNADAVARLTAWAEANSETFDSTNGSFSATNSAIVRFGTDNSETNTTALIAIISIIGVTAIGGYFLLRKKKEQ